VLKKKHRGRTLYKGPEIIPKGMLRQCGQSIAHIVGFTSLRDCICLLIPQDASRRSGETTDSSTAAAKNVQGVTGRISGNHINTCDIHLLDPQGIQDKSTGSKSIQPAADMRQTGERKKGGAYVVLDHTGEPYPDSALVRYKLGKTIH
jgi:hypothetical protein